MINKLLERSMCVGYMSPKKKKGLNMILDSKNIVNSGFGSYKK